MAVTYCSAPRAAVALLLLVLPGLVQNVNEMGGTRTLMGTPSLNGHLTQAQVI